MVCSIIHINTVPTLVAASARRNVVILALAFNFLVGAFGAYTQTAFVLVLLTAPPCDLTYLAGSMETQDTVGFLNTQYPHAIRPILLAAACG